MLTLQGASALSPFRIAKLLSRLRALEPSVTGLSSRFVHFVDVARPLSEADAGILDRLLTYGPRMEDDEHEEVGDLVIVVPRAGTISSWSSKATDIAQVCGLEAVQRIERGIAYRVQSRQPLGRERLASLSSALF